MDPLVLLNQAESQGRIPKGMASKVRKRLGYLTSAVARVERASGLKYPPYYVEPVLPLARSGAEYGQMGVYFARVVPTTVTGTLSILVQFTAALVAFASKGTIEAVAAHEFTHYVDLVKRASAGSILSDQVAGTLFEAGYADTERTVQPSAVFRERSLVGLVNRKFKDGLSDERLNRKVDEGWIRKKLPVRLASPEENRVAISMAGIASTSFDPAVLQLISRMKEKKKR